MAKRLNKEAMKDAIKYMENDNVAKVGFFQTAKYEDGTPVAYVAAIQEFGYKAIPPRSFIRTTISEEKQNWADKIGKGVKAAIRGKAKMGDVMESVAALAAGDMRVKISDIHEPPLKKSTIAARRRKSIRGKASKKPLVASGIMLASLVHIVEAE